MESFPLQEDMNGAVRGLFLLHTTYHFRWTDLHHTGLMVPPFFKTHYIKSDIKLYYKDFEVIGKIAYKRKLYDQAYELLNVALYLVTFRNIKCH